MELQAGQGARSWTVLPSHRLVAGLRGGLECVSACLRVCVCGVSAAIWLEVGDGTQRCASLVLDAHL